MRAYYFSVFDFFGLVRELREGQHILPNVGVAIIAFPIVRPPGLEVEENTRAKFDRWLQRRELPREVRVCVRGVGPSICQSKSCSYIPICKADIKRDIFKVKLRLAEQLCDDQGIAWISTDCYLGCAQ